MASKDQYEFFRSLYEEEERTYDQLEGRAKVYLGVVAAFLATVFLKAPEVMLSAKALEVPWWSILLEAILLTITLILIMHALRMREYETVNDAEKIIEEFGDNIPSDAEFFDDRIADYAVAASRNLKSNNETATTLIWANRLLVLSMIVLMIIFVTAAFRSLK